MLHLMNCYSCSWGINFGMVKNHYCTVSPIYLGTHLAVLVGYHIVADSLPDKSCNSHVVSVILQLLCNTWSPIFVKMEK